MRGRVCLLISFALRGQIGIEPAQLFSFSTLLGMKDISIKSKAFPRSRKAMKEDELMVTNSKPMEGDGAPTTHIDSSSKVSSKIHSKGTIITAGRKSTKVKACRDKAPSVSTHRSYALSQKTYTPVLLISVKTVKMSKTLHSIHTPSMNAVRGLTAYRTFGPDVPATYHGRTRGS